MIFKNYEQKFTLSLIYFFVEQAMQLEVLKIC